MGIKIEEKVTYAINDVRGLNLCELFGLMAVDGANNPTLRDAVFTLATGYTLKCDPSTKTVEIYNDHYSVKFFPWGTDGIRISYWSKDNNLNFLNPSAAKGFSNCFQKFWSIDELLDFGICDYDEEISY